jgi:outer membrane receptor protein involved in Fe transport
MKQRLLVSSIIMGLCASLSIGNALAQTSDDQNADQKKKDTTELQGITVTGSLIPRAQIETATPVVTITSQDIEKQGFKNVYDALRSLPTSVGSVQDSQFTNSFTPGANTISLLGLDPSFTLVLMNGKPLADYPFLYNSNSNFVDLATIPNFLVDHIDIVPGNQSAIYGSAAIAGVINIITKQKVDGVYLDYRTGGYTDGGGQQQRLQLAGGHSWGKLDVLWGIELNNQNPVFGYQRSYTDNAADNPTLNGAPPVPTADRLVRDPTTNKNVDPGAATCAAISNLMHGDEQYILRPQGYECGSYNSNSFTTFSNQIKSANGYGSAKYQLNDNMQLYADLLISTTKTEYLVGGTSFWNTLNGGIYGAAGGPVQYIYDLDSQHLVLAQHIFAPEEIGDQANGAVLENSYVVNFGVRGTLGNGSDWNYDVGFHRSQYDAASRARRLLTTKVTDFFLGQQSGYDPKYQYYPAYHLRSTPFYGAITPAQFDSISDFVRSDSETYTQQLNATVTNTDLFTLPAGSAGFAAVLEAGNQYWDNPVDPRITAGDFFGTGGTSGHGTRDRQAAAAELNLPIFSMLTADVSGRYDRYDAAGNSQGKFTYKVGLEFRPIDTLLFRANYATAFRAPDMGYLFSTGSSFYTSGTDYYNCRKTQGDNYTTCNAPYDSVAIQGFQNGNKDLKYITAKSFGFGGVWSPTSNFNLKLDYYRVNIDNEVNSYSIDTILQKEADCRLGHTRGGTPVDGNSPSCQAFIADVGRNPLDANVAPGQLNSVTTVPINVSDEVVSGITANAAYKFDAGRFGTFTIAGDYNTTLKHQYRQFPTDPVDDLLRDTNYYDQFKDIGAGTLTWDIGSWSSTVRGTRYGKTWSYDGSYTVAPWMVYNATLQYNFSDDAALTLISNNIFNSRPPVDRTYSAYPYYNIFDYNSFGRLVMVELNVHFGGGKKD